MKGIFLDVETTGLDAKQHRIIEIAFMIVDIRDGSIIEEYQRVVKQSDAVWELRDRESIKINGFSYEKMEGGIEESVIAEEMLTLFSKHQISRDNALFICQNPSFDRTFLAQIIYTYTQEKHRWPYHWLDLASMFWSRKIGAYLSEGRQIPDRIPLSKDAIARAYGLPEEEKPHGAMNGVKHLFLCFNAVMKSTLPSSQKKRI